MRGKKENKPGLSRRGFLTLALGASMSALAYVILGNLRLGPSGTTPTATTTTGASSPQLSVEEVAVELSIPWSMVFVSPGEAVLTERAGRVSLLDITNGRMSTLGSLEVAAVGEGGLLGAAVSRPGPRLYLYHTYRQGSQLLNRIIRFDSLELKDPAVVIDRIPGASIHDGGRIRIGPDEKLYGTTGDATQQAQHLDTLAGKILRLNPDGTVPSDNPFGNSPVYSYGHRNPQGIDWRPGTTALYSTEHGPTGELGLRAHDELNLIVPGGNYGWPEAVGIAHKAGFIDPIFESGEETWAPSGGSFYSGKNLEAWAGNFFFATLRGEHLHRVVLSEDGRNVVTNEKLFDGTYGRLRDVVEGPDGNIYLLTSNRDGRGSPRRADDKVLRITGKA